MRSGLLLLITVALLILTGCTKRALFDDVHTFDGEGWRASDTLSYKFPISDTAKTYNVLLHIRNTKNYDYSNLWLFIETTAPNGQVYTDTLEIMLADPSGRWLGKGIGNVNSMLIPYMPGVKFTQRGIYTLSIHHAMRVESLTEIMDLGVRIIPYQEKHQ